MKFLVSYKFIRFDYCPNTPGVDPYTGQVFSFVTADYRTKPYLCVKNVLFKTAEEAQEFIDKAPDHLKLKMVLEELPCEVNGVV